ncbi:N-acetyltransferase [Aquimarina sp. BL5]|uniref:GNAT family N-acetyltransferase n=1 Tax=Aquimarina sp. BL5 TaxID=1714860 RepID=UPI000E48D046|nr:GNAT family N-acetyltransferase [Aquimarina sp. BL5]AXT50073.1 N-acetyltransferase [Aquimarina sp. BL5]RKM95146.1 GNAT family N-acetyltransferase [Aquimarina sp. BL5]
MNPYLFQSERLGFRNWTLDDLDPLAAMNNDDDVMEFFPFKPSRKNTEEFILRMQKQFTKNDFCYFAVDILDSKDFIGFIGLCEQSYLEHQDTFVDIGWRLKKSVWNQGYATEGAKACLDFGFNTIGLNEIYSVASEINLKSELIMKKIGMTKSKIFDHPKLTDYSDLVSCVLYNKIR